VGGAARAAWVHLSDDQRLCGACERRLFTPPAVSRPDLMSVYYEREMSRPVDELRAELRVELLPRTIK